MKLFEFNSKLQDVLSDLLSDGLVNPNIYFMNEDGLIHTINQIVIDEEADAIWIQGEEQ